MMENLGHTVANLMGPRVVVSREVPVGLLADIRCPVFSCYVGAIQKLLGGVESFPGSTWLDGLPCPGVSSGRVVESWDECFSLGDGRSWMTRWCCGLLGGHFY